MTETVYVETSIISYLIARPSRDLISAARQQITIQWWEYNRKEYQIFAINWGSTGICVTPNPINRNQYGEQNQSYTDNVANISMLDKGQMAK